MKEIKIGLEHRDMFQVMTNCKVKRVVMGLMDVARGEEPRDITKDILPAFTKLREQLEADNGEGTPGGGIATRSNVLECKWHDGLDELLDTYDGKRRLYEEKVKALRDENDTVIKAEHDACEAEDKALEDEHKALEREYKSLMARLKACEGDEDGRRRYKGKFMALEKRRKALIERRRALDGRHRALIERSVNFLAASASNLEKECGVLKEENKLLRDARADFDEEWKPIDGESEIVNRESEIIGSKLNDREAFKADAEDELPLMPEGVSRPTEEQVREYMRTVLHVRKEVAEEEARKFLEYYDKRDSWKKEDGEKRPLALDDGGRKAGNVEFTFTPEVWKVIDENWEELKDAVYKIKTEKEKSEDIPLSVLESIPLSVEAWDVLDHHFDELVRLFHL